MKIRTRLLLVLLPTLIGGITFMATLLAYHAYQNIFDSFEGKLKSAVMSGAALENPHLQNFENLQKKLNLSKIYSVPLDSPLLPSIPKSLFITPIYPSEEGKKMTAYQPVFNQEGHITSVLAADILIETIDTQFKKTLLIILVSSVVTILVMTMTLYLVANNISRPVQQLTNSALAIAAGQYGESIPTQGPKEIAELANTLNTMSECLYENINRLKENSLLREKLYGEHECAMLLQHLMLQKNIDDCRSEAVAVRPITFFSDNPRGLLVDFPKTEEPDTFQIHMAEAHEDGFEGMYQLLTQYKFSKESQTHTSVLLNQSQMTLQYKGKLEPLVWSLNKKIFLEFQNQETTLESGDLFFLFNEGFFSFYKEIKTIQMLLGRVLKIFAQDGLDTISAMLTKEIAFALKRKDLDEDLHLLCFQSLY